MTYLWIHAERGRWFTATFAVIAQPGIGITKG